MTAPRLLLVGLLALPAAARADFPDHEYMDHVSIRLRAMGLNPMDRAPSRVVLETAVSSVAERAEELIAGIDLAPSRPAARGDRPPQAAAA